MTEDLLYGFPRDLHERAERFIASDILCCDTMLINDLLDDPLVWIDCFSVEQIERYFDDSPKAVAEYLDDHPDLQPEDWLEMPFEERSALAKAHGFEPVPQEIYEWWRITSSLADQLVRQGQPVLRNSYGDWWGRCTTGQAIILDGIIQQILEQS